MIVNNTLIRRGKQIDYTQQGSFSGTAGADYAINLTLLNIEFVDSENFFIVFFY